MSQVLHRYRYTLLFVAIVSVYVLIYWTSRWTEAHGYDFYALSWVTFRSSRLVFFAAVSLLLVSIRKPAAAIISVLGFILAMILSELIGVPMYDAATEGGTAPAYVPYYPWIVFIRTYIFSLISAGAGELYRSGKLRKWRQQIFKVQDKTYSSGVAKDILAAIIFVALGELLHNFLISGLYVGGMIIIPILLLYSSGIVLPVAMLFFVLASLVSKKHDTIGSGTHRLSAIGVAVLLAVAVVALFPLFFVLQELWVAAVLYFVIGCVIGFLAMKDELVAAAFQTRKLVLVGVMVVSVLAILFSFLAGISPGRPLGDFIFWGNELGFGGFSLYCLMLGASMFLLRSEGR